MTTQAAGLLILTQANGWMSIQTAVVYIWNKTWGLNVTSLNLQTLNSTRTLGRQYSMTFTSYHDRQQ